MKIAESLSLKAELVNRYFRAGMQRLVFRTEEGSMITASIPSEGEQLEEGGKAVLSYDGRRVAVLDEE